MKFILLILVVILTGCGKEKVCTVVTTPKQTISVGTLEAIQCPGGQMVGRVTPKYLPGGAVVTHLVVECIEAQTQCK